MKNTSEAAPLLDPSFSWGGGGGGGFVEAKHVLCWALLNTGVGGPHPTG